MEQNLLEFKVTKSKFRLRSNGCAALEASGVTYRSPWKFISRCYDKFAKDTKFKKVM